MRQLIRKHTQKQSNKGFTLVEVIVVIVVLAILAAIILPALLGYIDRAHSSDVVLEARYAYIDAQAALTEFYGQDTSMFQDYYNSKTNSGFRDYDGNYTHCCVITHQSLRSIQGLYKQGGDARIQQELDKFKAADNNFSYGAYKTAYLILKEMDSLGTDGKYLFTASNRASATTYDDFCTENASRLTNCNPVIYQLYFDEKGRVVMLEYGNDGYLVRYQKGQPAYVEKNGKTYRSQ